MVVAENNNGESLVDAMGHPLFHTVAEIEEVVAYDQKMKQFELLKKKAKDIKEGVAMTMAAGVATYSGSETMIAFVPTADKQVKRMRAVTVQPAKAPQATSGGLPTIRFMRPPMSTPTAPTCLLPPPQYAGAMLMPRMQPMMIACFLLQAKLFEHPSAPAGCKKMRPT